MTIAIAELLTELTAADIRLSVANDQLLVDAPRGALNPGLIERLREAKPGLMLALADSVREAVAACTSGGLADVTLALPDGGAQRIVGEPWAVEAAVREHLSAAALRRRTRDYLADLPPDDRAWLARPRGEPCAWCGLRSGHSARCRQL